MRVGYGIWKDEKGIGFLFDYRIESRAYFRAVFYLIILKGGSQASGGALCLPQFALFACVKRTRKDAHAGNSGHSLLKYFQAFTDKFKCQLGYARHVSSWPRKAVNKPSFNWITTKVENNR